MLSAPTAWGPRLLEAWLAPGTIGPQPVAHGASEERRVLQRPSAPGWKPCEKPKEATFICSDRK